MLAIINNPVKTKVHFADMVTAKLIRSGANSDGDFGSARAVQRAAKRTVRSEETTRRDDRSGVLK